MSDEVGLAPRGVRGRVATTAVFVRPSVLSEVQRRRVGVLAGVFVAPAYRRTGLARRLVTHALQWCRAHGYTHITLQASDAAEPLYRELGFEDDRGLVLNLE